MDKRNTRGCRRRPSYADQPNSVTTVVQSARTSIRSTLFDDFRFSAGFALCCGPRQVGRDILVVLLLVRAQNGSGRVNGN